MFVQLEDFFFRENYLNGCSKPAVYFLASAHFHVNFKIVTARLWGKILKYIDCVADSFF